MANLLIAQLLNILCAVSLSLTYFILSNNERYHVID